MAEVCLDLKRVSKCVWRMSWNRWLNVLRVTRVALFSFVMS